MNRRRLHGLVLAMTLMGIGGSASLAQVSPSTDPVTDYAARVMEAGRNGERVSLLSAVAPSASLGDSYRAARLIVEARLKKGDRVAGFKGGLARPGQQLGGKAVDPAVGVLFRSGLVARGGRIALADYRMLVVECELAFTFGRRISHRIKSVEELKSFVASARPAIELPDMALNGAVRAPQDLVAINMGSARYILGPAKRAAGLSLGDMNVVLSRDGKEVARGSAAENIGDPWVLLLRLVNTAVANGYAVERGQSILTGAIAVVPNAPAGKYSADFGSMGGIQFTIDPAGGRS